MKRETTDRISHLYDTVSPGVVIFILGISGLWFGLPDTTRALFAWVSGFLALVGLGAAIGACIRPDKSHEKKAEDAPALHVKPTDNPHTTDQYTRLSSEVRKLQEFVWQIPSFTFTIAGALVGVSFEFIHDQTRIIVLILTALFVFVMGQVTVKHRFGMGWRSVKLEEIENDWSLTTTPRGTDDQLRYLKRMKGFEQIKGPFPEWLIRRRSEIWLAWLLFLTSAGIVFVALVPLVL